MPHIHPVIDQDKHFVINSVTRKIEPESPEKKKLIQFDHNSERYTFEIERYVDGHDMSLCNVVQVHYINISSDRTNTSADVYEATDLAVVDEDETKVIFSWLISNNATKLEGTLNFAIRYACVEDEIAEYIWNTEPHSGIIISNGISNTPIIVEEYADILEQWRNQLFGIGSTEEQKILDLSNAQQKQILDLSKEQQQEISEKANLHLLNLQEKKEEIVNTADSKIESISELTETKLLAIENKGEKVMNEISANIDNFGLSVVDGCLCITYDSN